MDQIGSVLFSTTLLGVHTNFVYWSNVDSVSLANQPSKGFGFLVTYYKFNVCSGDIRWYVNYIRMRFLLM